ncbi:DEAD/DEAH box helicase [Brevibacillus fortis]|uniref:Restriction endonuclease n=1 Tax=Brevibacillus fortis TaxID=2126352 RepID=A0A2P7VDR2_9BACL|nr:DEAD/DEAH box helicase family protein [Brevibacillus fortis]PSJ97329.1 restriction endonuclease [Brevibacillus fortis]
MELKSYQKKVIKQLTRFLELMNETNSTQLAYNAFWNEQDVPVGHGGVEPYKNNIKYTPHICFKVPTGGGKTFIASSSIKPIFEAMAFTKTKAVVWLVPSNSILEQTIKNLSDPEHPYRQKLDVDFNGRVEVYTKEQLLNGQNFNPTAVSEQLSIFILSYDTLRSRKKEDRKIYQENGNLNQFTKFYSSPETLVKGIDDTALIQVINQLSPVIIVDESHNATTDLSIEMLVNLNPSFVLDLTATPKKDSNIISYVDAIELKKENMVKLPVIVYNRNNHRDVILDAIDLRNKLEVQALEQQPKTGKYIRPIVLFQAQPKGNENNETFEKLKEELINIGIPSEYVAIKTSEINELKGVDLLSPDCSIRYIITVNALKEGWDCPFAYVLATLANKSSQVDVEQILGRILRQPYAKKTENPFLNMSYVLSSSNNFRDTLDNIVTGLNRAGFSKNDYRAPESEYKDINQEEKSIQTDIFNSKVVKESKLSQVQEKQEKDPGDFFDIDFNEVRKMLEDRKTNDRDSLEDEISSMFASAMVESKEYSKRIDESETNDNFIQPPEIRNKMKYFTIEEKYKKDIKNISLPQFFIQSEPSLFIEDGLSLLTKERLADGFSLKDKDTAIDFDTLENYLVKVDIEGSGETTPKYSKLSKADTFYFKEYFSKLPLESKVRNCEDIIYKQINKLDTVDDKELRAYINRVIENMTKDQIDNLENFVHSYADKIKKKIKKFEEDYLEQNFDQLIEQGSIVCEDNYIFKEEISPIKTISTIPKSLYKEEENVNNFEYKVINELVALDNVKWWHRNIDRRGFNINGYLNHYPDFILMTKSGKLILVETKGDHLENAESKRKVKLGRSWQHQAGNLYRYYMVFEHKDLKLEGAYHFDKFIEIFKGL